MDLDRVGIVYDQEIVPIWGRPFSDLLRKYMPLPLTGTVLEVGCSSGYLSIELANFLAENSRIIALEPFQELLDIAFHKREDVILQKKVFFQHHFLETFRFADGVFSSIFSNLALFYVENPDHLLRELLRLLKPKGKSYFTLPLRGSFQSFFSTVKQHVLLRGEDEVAQQIDLLELGFPTPEEVLHLFNHAGFAELSLNVAPFQMIFEDTDLLIDSPFIRSHFIDEWKPYLKELSPEQFCLELKILFNEQKQSNKLALAIQAGCVQAAKV